MSVKTTETCSRCNGRMLHDPSTDDRVCFNCGHVAYAQAVMEIVPGAKLPSRPSRGGYRLD